MTQDDGWRLLMLGRRLERVQFLATLLADRLSARNTGARRANSNGCSMSAVSASPTARATSRRPQLAPVLQLLVFDQASPRALGFQWSAIRPALADLADSLGAVAEEPFEQADRAADRATASTAGVEEEGEARRRAGDNCWRRHWRSCRKRPRVPPTGWPRATSRWWIEICRRYPRERAALRRAARDAVSLRPRGGAFAPATAPDPARRLRAPDAASSTSIRIEPQPAVRSEHLDAFGNSRHARGARPAARSAAGGSWPWMC